MLNPMKVKWATAPAKPATKAEERLRWRKFLNLYPPFVPYPPRQRTHPREVMPDAESVVVAAIPYWHSREPEDHLLPQKYSISRSAWGADYHDVGVQIMGRLLEQLIGDEAAERAYVQVDAGPLEERAFALLTGLGYLGANGSIFVPPYGSWVFLGICLTDVRVKTDRTAHPTKHGDTKCCCECGRCIQACPTGALEAPYRINWRRCLSYLTQDKGFLPPTLRISMGKRIFGCDACQLACPVNQDPEGGLNVFAPTEEDNPDLLELVSMSDETFEEIYKKKSFSWRGRRTLQRNALIALGNTADSSIIADLVSCLDDARPVIRGHAIWTISQISSRLGIPVGDNVKSKIEDVLNNDEDVKVLKEARNAADSVLS